MIFHLHFFVTIRHNIDEHWNPRVDTIPILSSLVAIASDDKVSIKTISMFQWTPLLPHSDGKDGDVV